MKRKLKVWWIPQVPMKAFEVEVYSLEMAHVLLKTLGLYDLFQFNNNIKPDYCNVGGLSALADDGEWEDWETEDGDGIDTLTLEQCRELDAVVSA